MLNDEPTILKREDLEAFAQGLKSGEFATKVPNCEKCNKEFFPSCHDFRCDECYFAQFPKEQVTKFCKSIINDMFGS